MVSVLHDDDFLISVMREKYEAKGRALGKKEGKAEVDKKVSERLRKY